MNFFLFRISGGISCYIRNAFYSSVATTSVLPFLLSLLLTHYICNCWQISRNILLNTISFKYYFIHNASQESTGSLFPRNWNALAHSPLHFATWPNLWTLALPLTTSDYISRDHMTFLPGKNSARQSNFFFLINCNILPLTAEARFASDTPNRKKYIIFCLAIGLVVHSCNHRNSEAEAGDLKFEASQQLIEVLSQKKEKKKENKKAGM